MELQHTLFHIAVILLFLVVFAEASLSKIFEGSVPDWFVDQFKETWLGKFPIKPMYWFIALFELAIAGSFVMALVMTEFTASSLNMYTGFGLIGAMVLFSMLCFGQRVSFDFAGAANSFFYASLSGVLWYIVMHLK